MMTDRSSDDAPRTGGSLDKKMVSVTDRPLASEIYCLKFFYPRGDGRDINLGPKNHHIPNPQADSELGGGRGTDRGCTVDRRPRHALLDHSDLRRKPEVSSEAGVIVTPPPFPRFLT